MKGKLFVFVLNNILSTLLGGTMAIKSLALQTVQLLLTATHGTMSTLLSWERL